MSVLEMKNECVKGVVGVDVRNIGFLSSVLVLKGNGVEIYLVEIHSGFCQTPFFSTVIGTAVWEIYNSKIVYITLPHGKNIDCRENLT